MNIKIILKQPYPHGMACTNRIHHYAKGLQEQGHQVEIIVPIPLEDPADIKNQAAAGQYQGINFCYAGGTAVRSKSFVRRRLHDMLSPLKAAFYLRKEAPDAILLVSTYLYHILLFKLVARSVSAVYLNERSEFPFVFKKKKGLLHSIYKKLYNQFAHHCFDGIIVISNSLRAYYTQRVGRATRLLLVPIIMDAEEFSQRVSTMNEPYLAYAGNLSAMKDGVNTLIDAFRMVHQQYPHMKLYLVGGGSNADRQKVEEQIEKYQLQEHILLTGYVTREQLIDYLIGAKALVLAKPDNQQASFCFPSKLGEYLATGNPVITTSVGEIPAYLTNDHSAFLAQADNAEDFSKKIVEALANPIQAQEVGQRGKETARAEFDYRRQGESLSEFIHALFFAKQNKKKADYQNGFSD